MVIRILPPRHTVSAVFEMIVGFPQYSTKLHTQYGVLTFLLSLAYIAVLIIDILPVFLVKIRIFE
jgi:hypothetical protein